MKFPSIGCGIWQKNGHGWQGWILVGGLPCLFTDLCGRFVYPTPPRVVLDLSLSSPGACLRVTSPTQASVLSSDRQHTGACPLFSLISSWVCFRYAPWLWSHIHMPSPLFRLLDSPLPSPLSLPFQFRVAAISACGYLTHLPPHPTSQCRHKTDRGARPPTHPWPPPLPPPAPSAVTSLDTFSQVTGHEFSELVTLFFVANVASCFLYTDVARFIGPSTPVPRGNNSLPRSPSRSRNRDRTAVSRHRSPDGSKNFPQSRFSVTEF